MKNKKIYIDLLTKSTGECSVRKQFSTSRPRFMYYDLSKIWPYCKTLLFGGSFYLALLAVKMKTAKI